VRKFLHRRTRPLQQQQQQQQLALLLWVAAALLLLLPAATPAAAQTADDVPSQEIPEISIKILRKSGPSCQPGDQEEIRGRLMTWGNEFPGVEPYSAFVQPLGPAVEVGGTQHSKVVSGGVRVV
jgi:hypothetical protein